MLYVHWHYTYLLLQQTLQDVGNGKLQTLHRSVQLYSHLTTKSIYIFCLKMIHSLYVKPFIGRWLKWNIAFHSPCLNVRIVQERKKRADKKRCWIYMWDKDFMNPGYLNCYFQDEGIKQYNTLFIKQLKSLFLSSVLFLSYSIYQAKYT